jgi:hypothetical protein
VHKTSFRALIALDSPAGQVRRPALTYSNHTHTLMVKIHCPGRPGSVRYFPVEICWDDAKALRPGDRAVVTINMSDDDAGTFFCAGQRFRLWCGRDVGHGTISRRVYTDYTPS